MFRNSLNAGSASLAHLLSFKPKVKVATTIGAGGSGATIPLIAAEPNAPVQIVPASSGAYQPVVAKPKPPTEPKGFDPDDPGEPMPDEEDEEGDADEEDDDSDENDAKKSSKASKAARTAERARCAAIVGSDEGRANPEMAAHLAFKTGMSAAKAKELLATAPKSNTLASRMAAIPNAPVGAGADPAPTSPKASAEKVQASWDKAFKRGR